MLMETRVRRLMTAIAHAETPRTRTLRVVGRASGAASAEAGCEVVATARFVLLEYRLNAQHLYGGTSRFGLRRAGDGFVIAWKRVDLVNAEGTHEPMSVPF
jgi:3-phenylpropionate/cinnamic acid dioxygenase small subunit